MKKTVGTVKYGNESYKVSWEMEKPPLHFSNLEAKKKFKEVDEKNNILLDCLEEHGIEVAENLITKKSFQLQEKEETFRRL